MKRVDFGQVINTLANVGVIAGIIFVALEINQNTKSAEVNAYQNMVGQIARLNELTLENVRPFALMGSNPQLSLADLSQEEWEEVISIALIIFRHGDMAFFQRERGLISQERLESVLGPVKANLCTPIYQEIWEMFRNNFVLTYRDYVDAGMSAC